LRVLRITGITILALLFTLVLLAAWLLNSQSGSRAVLNAARGWLPAGLSVAQVSGAISGTLRITRLHYRDESAGLDLRVEQAELEFSPAALLRRRLTVSRAALDGVRLELFAGKAAAAPASTRDPWQAPIDMSLNAISLSRGEFHQPGTRPLAIDGARLTGSWINSRIEVQELFVDSADGHVELTTRIGSRAPRLEQLRGKFRWRVGEHLWQGEMEASGGREDLQLTASLDTPVKMRLAGNLNASFENDVLASWRARLTVPRFDPHPLVTTKAFETMALELDANGGTDRINLHGVLSLDDQRVLIEQLAASRSEHQLELSALRLRLDSQPGVLKGNARLRLDAPRSASASLEWDEIKLPEAWAGANFRFAGRAALTAGADRFAANGRAQLARASRIAALTFRVDGDSDALRIEELELTQMPGGLSLHGHVDLAAPLRWQLQAKGEAFDPSLFFESWPGTLDFDLTTDGEWQEAAPRARLVLQRLEGRLRGRAVSGNADLTVGKDLRPRGTVHLKSGSAVVDATATPGARPRVEARVVIGALEEWRKDLRGAVNLQLTSFGRWPAIEIQARAEATKLRRGGDSIESATLSIDGSNTRSPRGTVEFKAQGLDVAGFQFERASAKLHGDEPAHRLELDASGATLSLALQAGGALNQKAWDGRIESLTLEIEKLPPLALAQPVRLGFKSGSIALDTACLQGGDIAICAGLRGGAGNFVGNYSIKALPLELITALAAPDSPVTVAGLIEGAGEFSRGADGVFSGKGTLGSTSGVLAQGTGDDALRLAYRDFKLDADLSRGNGTARVHGVLVDQGELDGTLTVGVDASDPPLAGRATIELRDLAPLGWWVPQLAQMHGSAQMSAEIGGTLGQPRLAFTLRGSGLDAEVPMLGVHLRDGSITARLKAEGGFEADGSINSGDGSLKVSGTRDPAAGVTLKIGGTRFLAANIPGARVAIAPDLALSGKPGALSLTGSVTVQEADVNLEKLSFNKSYSASPDVVVLDREQVEKNHSLGLTTDVRILFGEHVKLAGFGLDSTVKGELRVTEKPNQAGRATGEVRVAGTYEAFGRKLTIERGRLVYAGAALDDPLLDILAVRKIDDVTAKLQVTGSALQPKLDVFTDPAMSQTDAMSYLLTGKSASDLHGQDGAEVQSAAQSVGSVLGNRLAKRLGGKMGLVDEIGVEQNNDLGGSAFTVGKYLSPRLFVSYGVGLFEPGSAVTVRYEFSKRWSLEANDSPEDQHAGIRYRIEK
jgi:translocation and assembly module TamB